jgi:hypothetical protein
MQGMFRPQARGWYLATTWKSNMNGNHKVKISSRLLLELLAGRITLEQFRRDLGENAPGENVFKHLLDHGLTFSDAKMLPREIDEDDDHLLISFEDDPAAREFKIEN